MSGHLESNYVFYCYELSQTNKTEPKLNGTKLHLELVYNIFYPVQGQRLLGGIKDRKL